MTHTELQALRRFLFYSAPEAARWVAADEDRPRGVDERTWNRWESGARPIPENIAASVADLVRWRGQLVAAGHQAGRPLVVVVFDDADDWPRPGALRRPWQSAAAQLLADLGPALVHLVPFDAAAFRVWRQGHTGAPASLTPDHWAAHVLGLGSADAPAALLPHVPAPLESRAVTHQDTP
jgi:hypothetical protein